MAVKNVPVPVAEEAGGLIGFNWKLAAILVFVAILVLGIRMFFFRPRNPENGP